MSYTIGTRVGAICDADDHEVRLYGYGVYDGYFIPPPEILFLGAPIAHENPRITLDDGKVVWGCECWWGAEERIKSMIGSRKVVLVDIEDHRAESQRAE